MPVKSCPMAITEPHVRVVAGLKLPLMRLVISLTLSSVKAGHVGQGLQQDITVKFHCAWSSLLA